MFLAQRMFYWKWSGNLPSHSVASSFYFNFGFIKPVHVKKIWLFYILRSSMPQENIFCENISTLFTLKCYSQVCVLQCSKRCFFTCESLATMAAPFRFIPGVSSNDICIWLLFCQIYLQSVHNYHINRSTFDHSTLRSLSFVSGSWYHVHIIYAKEYPYFCS